MRAQISLDFLLAIAIAAVALGAIVLAGNEITELQKVSSVRQQLDSIGIELSRIISTSAILDDADPASIDFEIPELLAIGEQSPGPCDIAIDRDNEQITLSYTIINAEDPTKNKLIQVTKTFVEPENMTISPLNTRCGETITITTS
jgi:hypothetical protein